MAQAAGTPRASYLVKEQPSAVTGRFDSGATGGVCRHKFEPMPNAPLEECVACGRRRDFHGRRFVARRAEQEHPPLYVVRMLRDLARARTSGAGRAG